MTFSLYVYEMANMIMRLNVKRYDADANNFSKHMSNIIFNAICRALNPTSSKNIISRNLGVFVHINYYKM